MTLPTWEEALRLYVSGVIPQLRMSDDVLVFWGALHRWHVWEQQLKLRGQDDEKAKKDVALFRRKIYRRKIYPMLSPVQTWCQQVKNLECKMHAHRTSSSSSSSPSIQKCTCKKDECECDLPECSCKSPRAGAAE